MRRIVIAIGSILTGLVLLFSWPTSLNRAVATTTPAAPATTTSGTTSSGTTSTGATGSTGTTDAPSAAPPAASGTYVGAAASTRYGPVQVQITVTDGKATAAEALSYPSENPRDQAISSYAIPVLNSEAVAASSASIQMVSGATFTSQGYINSLQSALDQAGL